jgi:hydroxymethylglutaryl-CoA lyase
MNPWEGAGRRIHLQEVGTRDGLQAEAVFVPTETKIGLIDELSGTGVSRIEVTSFTSPQAIPALADADAVMQGIRRQGGWSTARWCPMCGAPSGRSGPARTS